MTCTLYQFTQVYNDFYIKTDVTVFIFQMYSSLTQSMKPKRRSIIVSEKRFWMKAVQVQNMNQSQEKEVTQEKKVEMVSKKSVSV